MPLDLAIAIVGAVAIVLAALIGAVLGPVVRHRLEDTRWNRLAQSQRDRRLREVVEAWLAEGRRVANMLGDRLVNPAPPYLNPGPDAFINDPSFPPPGSKERWAKLQTPDDVPALELHRIRDPELSRLIELHQSIYNALRLDAVDPPPEWDSRPLTRRLRSLDIHIRRRMDWLKWPEAAPSPEGR